MGNYTWWNLLHVHCGTLEFVYVEKCLEKMFNELFPSGHLHVIGFGNYFTLSVIIFRKII